MDDSLAVDPIMIPPGSKDTSQALSITALNVEGNMGQVTFTRNDSTFFYFDQAKKEGMIRLNGKDHLLHRCTYNKLTSSYQLSGKEVSIRVTKVKFKQSNGEDCAYGSSPEAKMRLGTSTLRLQDISIQDCPVN